MRRTTFAESLKRALVAYRDLKQLAPDDDAAPAAVVEPDRAHLTVANDLPLNAEMERSFRRWCDVWERRVGASQRRQDVSTPGAKTGARKAQADRAIIDGVGLDATALAWLHGRTTDGVRKLRLRHGLDPETGERIAAPATPTA